MRLYRITWLDDDRPEPLCAAWKGTQVDVVQVKRQLKALYMRDIQSQETDIATDKASMLALLNKLEGNHLEALKELGNGT